MDYGDVKIISFQDFPNICRICLSKTNTLKPFVQIRLLLTFKDITKIEIEPNDNLPENICDGCLSSLEDIYSFINLSKSSDANLRQILMLNDPDYYFEDTVSESQVVDDVSELSDKLKDETVEENDLPGNITKLETSIVLKSENEDDKKPVRHSTKRQPSKCEICSEQFSTKRELIEHQKKNSECRIRKYKCTMCDKAFYANFRLSRHMRSHTEETPYECKICLKKFKFFSNLKRHDDIAHKGLKPFKCDFCEKEFSRLAVKNDHMRTHTGECPFLCGYCEKSFKSRASRFFHEQQHIFNNDEIKEEENKSERKAVIQNIPKPVCKLCNITFKNKSAYYVHNTTKHKQQSTICSICGKSFAMKFSLQVHLRSHTGEKPYTCEICGNHYAHKQGLKRHIFIHNGKKPYECNICNKSFVQSTHLKGHMRTHNGEKPYVCKFCGRGFAVACNLKAHTRIHVRERK